MSIVAAPCAVGAPSGANNRVSGAGTLLQLGAQRAHWTDDEAGRKEPNFNDLYPAEPADSERLCRKV